MSARGGESVSPPRGCYVIEGRADSAAFDVTVNRGAYYEGGLADDVALIDWVRADELSGLLLVLDGMGYRQVIR